MKTLLLVTVTEFFKQRAGMFFVLLALLFGFLSGAEHHAFAVFFLTASNGMLYLGAIWLVYTLMCTQFLITLWKRPEYTFVYNVRLWPLLQRIFRFTLLAIGFLQPLIYYGVYLIAVAVQDKLLAGLWPIFPYYFLLIIMIGGAAAWRITNPQLYVEKSKTRFFKWPFKRFASWTWWSLEWLFQEKGVTLLAGKLGAMLFTLGTLLYYSTDQYDLRLPAVGLSLAYLLNIGISFELYQWESETWLWGRSLPVSRWRRIGRIFLVHAIIIVPETLVSVRNGALSAFEIMQLYVLGLSVLVAAHLFFYKKEGLLDECIQAFLFGFIGLTLLILYKIPVLLIAGMFVAFTLLAYPRWYRV
ncbi:hypothetical protein MUK70_30075 [Dyadobacter chenwenxiniae]|uniref:Uncharacterized protein n=1 Tax=Dyadobacter chenwenxiniae TaxID=2906456 RepID=A0A9X1PLZ4_9BACT|nr:hypothetical protein [Dyadobacter chenwenxiniae]MCF0063570.1 hypothetical protein [Dyadobacter chenwenxiniae]UON83247.1 hypothetical protein MUK70_30075 [Dyadobacter chenwenxiniae]